MKTFYNDFALPITQGRKRCKSLFRLFALLLMCLVTGGAMAAQETELMVEFICNSNSTADFNAVDKTNVEKEGSDGTKIKASLSSNWSNRDNKNMRIADGSTITFTYTCPNGYEITKIGFCADFGDGTTENTIESTTTGPINIGTTGKSATLTKRDWNTTEVNIICDVTSNTALRVASMKVYYKKSSTGGDNKQNFTTFTATADNTKLKVGETANITVTAKDGDKDVTDLTYSYAVSLEGIISVENGKVTALAEGEATVTVSTTGNNTYNGATAEAITFNVTKKDVTLSATDLTLTEGETGKSTITSTPIIDGITYTYTSGNESVAKVATDGTVTAVAEGTAVITVKYAGNNEYNEATTTFNVTVNKKAVVGGASVEFLCNSGDGSITKSNLSETKDDITATFSTIRDNVTGGIKIRESVITITSATKNITKVEIITENDTYAFEKLGDKAESFNCTAWGCYEVVILREGTYASKNNVTIKSIKVYYEDGTPTAPTFTTQPETTTTLALGQELTLTAEASGTPAPTYQWYKNTTKSAEGSEVIEGATEKTYTATQEATGTTYYYCVATNSQGSATSNFAEVIVEKRELKLIGQNHTFAISEGTKNLGIVASYGGEVVENIPLNYVSDNTSVAEIDANGSVTPKSVGTANITVTFAGDDTYKPAKLTVVVTVTQGAAKPIIKVTSDGEGKNTVENYTEDNPYDKDKLYVWLEKPADFADSKYEIHYSIDNSKLDKTWNGTSELRTQTTYIYAQIYNKETKQPEGEVLETPIRFNFTLLAAFGSKDKDRIIDPGFQSMLTTADDIKKPYIIATFGSKGDDQKNSNGGVWLSVSKDLTMGNSEISGYQYVARGNFDAMGEGKAQFAGNSMEEPAIENGATYYMEESSDNGTFKIPVSGAYVMFEPKVGGTVNVILRQNGIIANEKDPKWAVMRMRPIYVCDETGKVHEDVKAMISTNSKMNERIFEFGNTAFKADTGTNPQTVEQSKANLKLYQQMVYAAGHSDCTIEYSSNGMSASLKDASGSDVSDNELNTYWKGNAKTEVTKNILHKYGKGWITLSKAYVRYSFDVEPGKTYFIMGHVTKIGACGYSFKRRVRDDNVWTEVMNKAERNISINENGTNLPAAVDKDTNTGITGVNVTLNRTFHKGVWTTLVLPFSVSPYTLAETFGEGTEVLHFGEVDGSTLNLVKHHHQMIVAGTPVLIRPKGEFSATDVINNVTFKNVSYNPGTPIKEMTGGGWKITGSYVQANMPANSYYVGYKADGTGNNVYLSTKVKTMNGTRAWFERYDTSAPAKLTSFSIDGVEDNTTTDIDSILTETEDRNANNATVYNLNGQVVSNNGTDGLANGIYIMNGKKIIIK